MLQQITRGENLNIKPRRGVELDHPNSKKPRLPPGGSQGAGSRTQVAVPRHFQKPTEEGFRIEAASGRRFVEDRPCLAVTVIMRLFRPRFHVS